MTIQRSQLDSELNQLLRPQQFRDYCPNGLQVEGRHEIQTLVTGVTASQHLIERAIEEGADGILVHHGYFWKGEDQTITGMKKNRIALLLESEVNLFAYHLPLDMHASLGNNAQLGELLGFYYEYSVGRPADLDIVFVGNVTEDKTLQQLTATITNKLQRSPTVIGDPEKPVARVAWCTGAAQSYFDVAIAAGVDVFITGEISEPSAHMARESGVAFIAAGHHATERYGVKAVGAHVAEKLGFKHRFIDIDNPA